MREAIIVSTARTTIGKEYRGSYDISNDPQLGGLIIIKPIERDGKNL
ncbi:MAG: hypothetical protein P8L83_03475 [Flavobacteriaceae bacterium]|nr:hypothetical protein [Flavobacteriaceae bacterium]